MTIYAGCDIPEDLYYHPDHDIWVRFEGDGTATMGMNDIAQTMAGKLLDVRFKAVGRRIRPGQSAATIESAKWVGPFVVPFDAEILAVNSAYEREITLANTDPYGAGWLIKVRPLDPAAARAALISGDAAVAHLTQRIRDRQIHCYRCEEV